jgi:polar amino acid transport system substrate-binding protein
VICALLLAACGLPRDPEGTLRRVEGGTLPVGVTENEPWTMVDDGGHPSGVEVELVEGFARDLDARVEYVTGSEAELFAALEARAVDLVIGGLTADNPWVSTAAVSRPYVTTRLVVARNDGSLPEAGIAGLEVAVERGHEAVALLEEHDAVPVPVDDLRGVPGPAAVEDWRLDDLGLVDTGVRLSEDQHVMVAPAGENALMLALDRFLFRERARVPVALRAAGSS